MEWISVKDRLPEEDDSLLRCDFLGEGEIPAYTSIPVLAYNGEEILIAYRNLARFVTQRWEWSANGIGHWMPLPKPPELFPKHSWTDVQLIDAQKLRKKIKYCAKELIDRGETNFHIVDGVVFLMRLLDAMLRQEAQRKTGKGR